MLVCPGCSKEIQEEWRFCRTCGHTLVSEIPPVPATVGDFVSSEVIARLIPFNELPGLLNKSLEVEEGQAALLFLNGRHDTTQLLLPASTPWATSWPAEAGTPASSYAAAASKNPQ